MSENLLFVRISFQILRAAVKGRNLTENIEKTPKKLEIFEGKGNRIAETAMKLGKNDTNGYSSGMNIKNGATFLMTSNWMKVFVAAAILIFIE